MAPHLKCADVHFCMFYSHLWIHQSSLATVDTKKHEQAVASSAVAETCIDAV